jgi:hypothetical protein
MMVSQIGQFSQWGHFVSRLVSVVEQASCAMPWADATAFQLAAAATNAQQWST